MKRNLFATYFSHAWIALIGVAFVPIYIRYLGIEAYGLIGTYTVLYSLLVFLDLGITPTLTREMSRFSGGASTATEVRDLLRTAEVTAISTATVVMVALWLASDLLASTWFNADRLSHETVAQATQMMGVVVGLRLVDSIYRGSVIGLQRLTVFAGFNVLAATARAVGAVAVLAFVSNTIYAFFLWQAIVSVASVVALAYISYASIPAGDRRARPSMASVRQVGGFAVGALGISLLSIGLTQVDKLLLSKLLPLDEFGRYSLAALVAVSLELITAPLLQTFGPQLSKLHAAGDDVGFANLYHRGAQFVTVIAGSAAVVLIVFAEPFLKLWTQDADLASNSALLLQVLTLGYLLNMFVWMPYLAQLAHRWTSLTLKVNTVAILLIVPTLFWIVPRFGAVGAAHVWVALNATYFFITAQLMHRRILLGEKWRWYLHDVCLPLAAAASCAFLIRATVDIETLSLFGQMATLIIAAGMALVAAAVASSEVRAFARSEMATIWAQGDKAQ